MKDNICFCHSLERGQKPRIFLLLKSLSPLQLHKLQDRQNAPPSTNMETTINVTIFTTFSDNAFIICVFVCSLKMVSDSALIIFICLLYHFQSIMECWSALTLYVHIVVTASNTKVLPASFFLPLVAFLPIQDVSGAALTHLGAPHTLFGSCYPCFLLVMDFGVHYKHKMCITWVQIVSERQQFFFKKGWIRPRADKEKKNQAVLFVLPAMTTLCTNNVGG